MHPDPSTSELQVHDRRDDDQWHGGLEFRTLAETIPALVFVTDRRGANIYTNVQFQRYVGGSGAGLLGNGWLAVIYDGDRDRAAATWAGSVAAGEPYEAQYRLRRHDGSYRWHLVRGVPMRAASGEVVRWMGNCTDIEELVRGAEARERFDAYLRAIGTSADVLLYIKDEEGRFVFGNNAVFRVVGCRREDLLGQALDQHIDPAVRQFAENDTVALASGLPESFIETWGTGAAMRTFRSIKAPMPLGDGRMGLAAISHEMTHEVQLRDRLDAAERRMSDWLEAISVIAWEANDQGKIVAVTQAFRDVAGLGQMPGPFMLADIIVERERGRIEDLWQFALTTGEPIDTETHVRDHVSGRDSTMRLVALPGRYGGAADTRWFGSLMTVQRAFLK